MERKKKFRLIYKNMIYDYLMLNILVHDYTRLLRKCDIIFW